MNRSIKKAIEVLTFVVDNPQKMSLSEMSAKLNMNKTTLFRFLTTLESLSIVTRKDEGYVPGIRLFELGSKVPVKQLIVNRIHPVLLRLTALTNETVNLAELHKNQVLYLDKTESQRSLQIQSKVGGYISLHSTALGKSILSILPEDLRDALITRLEYRKRTSKTINEPGKLQEEVRMVCQRGYSTDMEEMEEGLICVAAPVLLNHLHFYGAISCSGPTVRFTPARIEELAAELKQTALSIQAVFNEAPASKKEK